LFASVVTEKLLIQLASNLADHYVFRRAYLPHRFSKLFEELVNFERREIESVKSINGIQIDWNGNHLTVNASPHTMLIRAPLGKARKVFKHFSGIRVKNMRPVLVNQNARFVKMVVSIPANVWSLITNQNLLIRSSRQAFGENFGRRRDRDHGDIGVGAAHRFNHCARYVGDHSAPGADIVIDRAGQRVAMAMRFPMHGEIAACECLPEGIKAHLLIVFEG